MRKLEIQFNKNGYHHQQVYRQGDIAIYELTSLETGRILGYEVFEVQKFPERIIKGKMIDESEGTPSNEQWGIKGFTVWNKTAAMEKAEILRARRDRRNLAKRIGLESI